jgi:hypothetical protein
MSKFRLAAIVAAVVCGAAPSAQALENFIPLGLGYTPERVELPHPNSAEDRFIGQTDVYESEIDREQRERKIFENELSRFIDHDLSAEPLHTPQY